MISVIESEGVLEAAREMNRRDVQRVDGDDGHGDAATSEAPGTDSSVEDDQVWARTAGVTGLKGAEGQPICKGGSHYAWGPYPRNRRILADVALAAGWDVAKARAMERRCVERMAQHMRGLGPAHHGMDLSNPDQPIHYGKPYTFQHISWSFLEDELRREIRAHEPAKLALIEAAVLKCYRGNSRTGRKTLPPCPPGESRISDDVPVCPSDIERAQEGLERTARYDQAIQTKLDCPRQYTPPDKVKRRIKAFILSRNMSEADFCHAIGVTVEELTSFMHERKLRPQQESKPFHNALPYIERMESANLSAGEKRVREEAEGEDNVRCARRGKQWVTTKVRE